MRVLEAPAYITLEKFNRKVKSSFSHRMIIKYADKAGDVITVKTEDEFRCMVNMFKDQSSIRVQLARRHQQDSSSRAAPAATDNTVLESMINPVIIVNTVWSSSFVSCIA